MVKYKTPRQQRAELNKQLTTKSKYNRARVIKAIRELNEYKLDRDTTRENSKLYINTLRNLKKLYSQSALKRRKK